MMTLMPVAAPVHSGRPRWRFWGSGPHDRCMQILALMPTLLALAAGGQGLAAGGPRSVASGPAVVAGTPAAGHPQVRRPVEDLPAPPPLLSPVDGPVVTPYQAPSERYGRGHRGIDLAARPGTPIRASAEGTVVFVGVVAGIPVVSVEHPGGWRTTYQPVTPSVLAGQHVRAGDQLGTLATTPMPGGQSVPHLHLGLRHGEQYRQPILLASDLRPAATGPIRLVRLGAAPAPPPRVLPVDPAVPGDFSPGSLPAAGPISSPFGMRVHPVTGVLKLHDGTDVGAPCGAPIRAPHPGTVVQVLAHPAYGNFVIIDEGNGRRSGYAHQSAVAVRPGQQVRPGDLIGQVGTTGYSTGCHLHYMVWLHGQVVNPLAHL